MSWASRLEQALHRAIEDLSDVGAKFSLVGGLAVSARTEPRFTRDIDFAVAVQGDAEAERIIASLRRRGYEISAVLEQTRLKRLATVRLLPRGETEEGVIVDLLFAACGIEPEIVKAAERVELFVGSTLKVATIPHLIAMKVISSHPRRRPQDNVDLVTLVSRASRDELTEAEAALRLISERGFHRGKNLSAKLKKLIRGTERTEPRRAVVKKRKGSEKNSSGRTRRP